MTREKRTSPNSEGLYDVGYGFDVVGNRTSKTTDEGTVSYTLGSGNRMTGWSVTNWDATIDVYGSSTETIGLNSALGQLYVSNIVAVTPEVDGTNWWVYDLPVGLGTQDIVAAIGDVAGNVGYDTNTVVVTIVTNVAYSFNAAGCITNIAYTGSGGYSETTKINWNQQYQITSVATNGVTAESYKYDALGRRIEIVTGSTTNHLVYDGIHVIAEVDSSGTLQKSYTWNPAAADHLLAWTDYTGGETNTYYALTDHLGSVHAVTDESGSIVESYRFDAWGRVLGVYDSNGSPLSESAIGNNYLWQGKWFSWQTGLYFARSRWYDPITGRFISKDPSGIVNGLNLYVAFNNNPVNFVDPTGESAIEAADYWANLAGSGYNQGGFKGWLGVQTGNTMGMFINMWHAQEMEEHAGLAGEYWDECKGKSAKHMAAVGGYAALNYVQFGGLASLDKARLAAKAAPGGAPLRKYLRFREKHQIPGLRKYGEIRHMNIGKKHFPYNPKYWFK